MRIIAFKGRYEAANKLICAAKVQIMMVKVSPGILRVILEATEYIHRPEFGFTLLTSLMITGLVSDVSEYSGALL
ncbi:hypothetical protein PPUJ21368_55040 [Pseudomonas putida]|nr:hypothetical protein PPUJ21368_55040 [Pseudomonas putida]